MRALAIALSCLMLIAEVSGEAVGRCCVPKAARMRVTPDPISCDRLGPLRILSSFIETLKPIYAAGHVEFDPMEAPTGGAYFMFDIVVGHGCNGEATTRLDVQIPTNYVEVRGMRRIARVSLPRWSCPLALTASQACCARCRDWCAPRPAPWSDGRVFITQTTTRWRIMRRIRSTTSPTLPSSSWA